MPRPRIRMRALQAFVAVYEEQSFSRAANRESATQSGMSTQVKALESALGVVLLERGRDAFTLTPAGRIVLGEGRELLRGLFALERRIGELDGAVTGTVRVGIIPSLTRAVLPPALESFRSDHPNVEITVLEEYSYSLMRHVLADELDFALVPAGEVLGGLTSAFVGRDREVLAGRAGMLPERPQLAPVSPSDLNGLNLIVPSRRNTRRSQLETYFDAHGARPGALLEMDGMLATLEFVATTDWCAILPSALLYPDRDGSLRKLHPLGDPEMSTDYIMVRKLEKAPTRAAELLTERITAETSRILGDWPD